MNKSNPRVTPMIVRSRSRKEDQYALDENDNTNYHCIVESPLYIAIKTRPDLYMTASSLRMHVENPTNCDMIAAKRALQYLNETSNCSLMLKPGRQDPLSLHISSNWGSQFEKNRKSRTRRHTRYGDAVICPMSKLQKKVSFNSTMA